MTISAMESKFPNPKLLSNEFERNFKIIDIIKKTIITQIFTIRYVNMGDNAEKKLPIFFRIFILSILFEHIIIITKYEYLSICLQKILYFAAHQMNKDPTAEW